VPGQWTATFSWHSQLPSLAGDPASAANSRCQHSGLAYELGVPRSTLTMAAMCSAPWPGRVGVDNP
jgi:hypothetical protein